MRTAENLHPVRTDLKAKKTRTGMYKLIYSELLKALDETCSQVLNIAFPRQHYTKKRFIQHFFCKTNL